MSPRFLILALASPIVIPLACFLVCALAAGMSPAESGTALVEQCSQRRQNPLVSGLLGYVPIALLFPAISLGRRFGKGRFPVVPAAWAGLVAILVVLVWVQFEFWPKFLPDRVYPGFPHGLEFVIGPIFFAPVALVVGMGAAWIVTPRTE